jgi:hypothetical protein
MKSRVRSFCLAGLLVALAAVALPASSGAYVFWASNNAANPIGRANLDGTDANQNFLPGSPYFAPAVAVDGSHVYWTNGTVSGGDIERANLDGSEIITNFVPGAVAVRGLTVAGSFIYWSSGNCVGRATINGGEVENCFTGDGEGLNQVAVGGNRIYWTNRNLSYISSSNMQGEDLEEEFYEGESGNGLAAGADGIYFTNGKHGICFMSYDGKVLIEGVAPTHGGYGLAVSGNYLYWAAGDIGRVNLQGAELNEEFIKPASPAYDVAVEPSVAPPPPPPGPPAAATPTPSPIVKHTPLKCKKGFQRKSVRGKVRCVKKHKKHRHHR